MRKVILCVAVSLDGFIEGPNGEYDWCFTDQDYGMSDFFKRIDAMFIGRKSYEMLQSMDMGSNPFPKMEEYVFSNTLTSVKDDAVLISGDIKTAAQQIKRQQGKDIWMFGGASLTTSLMNDGLIDELMIAIHPILLGSGKPLFNNIIGRIPLTLTGSKTYSSGLVMVWYDVLPARSK
jgi:dihydrofolate reductase